ncbi:hypothetical protein MUP56_01025, partial [Patescibacteria group bacterium]|nr:hypothetical protein [Patescibacteria group bacterium]
DQRALALAQRAEFYLQNQNPKIHAYIDELESREKQIKPRSIRRHAAVERGLRIENGQPINTSAREQIGYKKRSSDVTVSRNPVKNGYLLNKIGWYPRRVILGGSMPPATGGVDALVTEALAHMATFIPRNSVFHNDIGRQVKLAQQAHDAIQSLSMPQTWKERAIRNIGASLGIEHSQETVEGAGRLYREGGIRLFRIYTIGSDPRIIETAKRLRQDPEMGNNIEIFVGQIPDKALASRLVDEANVDALIFGHGGGRQCTSADNGMAVTTLEEIYDIVRDPKFQNTTVLIEGGVGRNIGSMLILGVDGVLFNGRLVRGTIESPAGDIYVREKKTGKFCQPYPGSASAETQLIESRNSGGKPRTNLAGRIHT